MGTCGPTAPLAAGRVSELVSESSDLLAFSCLAYGRSSWAWAAALSYFRIPVLPFMPFRFAFRPGRPSLSDY